MVKVAAIIPVLAGVTEEYAKLCIESLRATTDWDIIVVSNGPGAKPDFSKVKGVTVHLYTRDQGQCRAVNLGARWANGADYIFISNDDMYYAPGWNRNLIFADMPVFSPNLVEPENNKGSAAPFLKLDAGYTLEEFDREKVDKFVADYNPLENQPLHEAGLNFPLFVRKDLWDFIGGYDEAYDPWGSNSDTDLQTRINLAGVQPMRMRDVLVYHFSNKSGTFEGHQDFYSHNIEYFLDKFGFDRDQLGSDVWYNKDMLPKDKSKIKFKQAKYEG